MHIWKNSQIYWYDIEYKESPGYRKLACVYHIFMYYSMQRFTKFIHNFKALKTMRQSTSRQLVHSLVGCRRIRLQLSLGSNNIVLKFPKQCNTGKSQGSFEYVLKSMALGSAYSKQVHWIFDICAPI